MSSALEALEHLYVAEITTAGAGQELLKHLKCGAIAEPAGQCIIQVMLQLTTLTSYLKMVKEALQICL